MTEALYITVTTKDEVEFSMNVKLEAIPQLGNSDLDKAATLNEHLMAGGGVSAEKAANEKILSKINRKLQDHKKSLLFSRTCELSSTSKW